MRGVVQRQRFAESAEDYRMDAGDVPCADGVYADVAFFSQRIFAASAISETIRKFFAGRFADVLSQR